MKEYLTLWSYKRERQTDRQRETDRQTKRDSHTQREREREREGMNSYDVEVGSSINFRWVIIISRVVQTIDLILFVYTYVFKLKSRWVIKYKKTFFTR